MTAQFETAASTLFVVASASTRPMMVEAVSGVAIASALRADTGTYPSTPRMI
jgi:hypothetical protein